jgi:hypothetical protein
VFTPRLPESILKRRIRPRLAFAAAGLLAAMQFAATPHCAAYHGSRPAAAGFADAVAGIVGIPTPAASYHDPDCPHCLRRQTAANGETIPADDQPPLTGDALVSPADASGRMDDGSYAASLQHPPGRSRFHAIMTLPRDTFAAAANFCIRPIAFAPAEVPPPGRFHPVPTRPAFAPR